MAYSTEQRKVAIDLLIQYDLQYTKVTAELGYPSSRELQRWYARFIESNTYSRKDMGNSMYSSEEKSRAISYYFQHGKSIAGTCKKLGYPHRETLRTWINEQHPEEKRTCTSSNLRVYLKQTEKEQAALDLCSRGSTAQKVANKYGVSRGVLYCWKHKFLPEGGPTKMQKNSLAQSSKTKSKSIEELTNEVKELAAETEALKKQINRLKLERDALQLATEIVKKDKGISLETLTNKKKAIVIGALREAYSLKDLLDVFKISKSSYCYQQHSLATPDKYCDVRVKLHKMFSESYESYGYRRLYLCIKKSDGSNYSEKVIRRLMHEEGLVVRRNCRKKYNSYLGEISPAVENLIQGDFHAESPNVKCLTDITEFSIPAGKVYLSPIIDCYDGLPVTWTIGTSPNADLVNTMLDAAIATLRNGEHPIIHSDRGSHYRWPGWIERMDGAGLIRSMSRKGYSPDNSACEGFFGRLKNEMFYGRSWSSVTIEGFTAFLDQYIHWYAEKRIKVSLGGMSPLQYRRAQKTVI